MEARSKIGLKELAFTKGAYEIWTAILNVSLGKLPCCWWQSTTQIKQGWIQGRGLWWCDMTCCWNHSNVVSHWSVGWWIAAAERGNETTAGEVLGDVRRLCMLLVPKVGCKTSTLSSNQCSHKIHYYVFPILVAKLRQTNRNEILWLHQRDGDLYKMLVEL